MYEAQLRNISPNLVNSDCKASLGIYSRAWGLKRYLTLGASQNAVARWMYTSGHTSDPTQVVTRGRPSN